mgnify:CR=1 FL=1
MGDIIKGVDIFISSQFYTFYTDGEIDMSQSLLKDLPQGKSNTYGYIMDDLSEYSYPPRPFSEAYDRSLETRLLLHMHGAWKYVMSSRRKYVTPPSFIM